MTTRRQRGLAAAGAVVAGGVIGFGIVFLGPFGLVAGAIAAVTWAWRSIQRRDLSSVGLAVLGGGLVVALVFGRILVVASRDPGVSAPPDAVAWLVAGFGAVLAGALLTVVGRRASPSLPPVRR